MKFNNLKSHHSEEKSLKETKHLKISKGGQICMYVYMCVFWGGGPIHRIYSHVVC